MVAAANLSQLHVLVRVLVRIPTKSSKKRALRRRHDECVLFQTTAAHAAGPRKSTGTWVWHSGDMQATLHYQTRRDQVWKNLRATHRRLRSQASAAWARRLHEYLRMHEKPLRGTQRDWLPPQQLRAAARRVLGGQRGRAV